VSRKISLLDPQYEPRVIYDNIHFINTSPLRSDTERPYSRQQHYASIILYDKEFNLVGCPDSQKQR
jgi:hypothetical protein